MLCSAVKCISPLKTLTTKHKPKAQMMVSLEPMNLKEDSRGGLGSHYCFSEGITEIDGSDEHTS